MIIKDTYNWDSPVRKITARAELYNGSALAATYTSNDVLKSLTVERVGDESKFFGFGICQKLNIHLIDKDRVINDITTAHSFFIYLDDGSGEYTPFPPFYVTEVHRDENTNELSITAYDIIYKFSNTQIKDTDLIQLKAPYTLEDFIIEFLSLIENIFLLNMTWANMILPDEDWEKIKSIVYQEGVNLDGTETIREIADAIAEVTQTYYYIDGYGYFYFKRFDKDGEAVLTITKDDYITLDSKTNRRLSDIASITELGDNVSTTSGISGTTQYIRNNPFWELRDDLDVLLEDALNKVGGFTINQFNCSWRGNGALEPGDKIALVTKDNNIVTSYLINDVITYDGGLAQETSWNYSESEKEHTNPTTIGEALKQTYARVDKVNKNVEIVVEDVSKLYLDNSSIKATVQTNKENVNKEIEELTNKVEATITAEDVTIMIEQGVDSVTTSTGFTFNEEGLHISKSNSEIDTTITEDGMTIYRSGDEILKADNEGVKAEDLHATTFLIVGRNSRFEDYKGNRTGCFWIADSEVRKFDE